MVDFLIKTLRFFRKPVYVSGVPNASALLNWGTDYRTSNDSSSLYNYPEVIFHFPTTQKLYFTFHLIQLKLMNIKFELLLMFFLLSGKYSLLKLEKMIAGKKLFMNIMKHAQTVTLTTTHSFN